MIDVEFDTIASDIALMLVLMSSALLNERQSPNSEMTVVLQLPKQINKQKVRAKVGLW